MERTPIRATLTGERYRATRQRLLQQIGALRERLHELRQRMPGRNREEPDPVPDRIPEKSGPVLDLIVQAPPPFRISTALWHFWLWLIDERPIRPLQAGPEWNPDSVWRLRVHLDPQTSHQNTAPPSPN